MALTKKHFEMVARNFRAQTSTIDQNEHWSEDQKHSVRVTLRNMALDLCADFRDENPNFDGGRFLNACGV